MGDPRPFFPTLAAEAVRSRLGEKDEGSFIHFHYLATVRRGMSTATFGKSGATPLFSGRNGPCFAPTCRRRCRAWRETGCSGRRPGELAPRDQGDSIASAVMTCGSRDQGRRGGHFRPARPRPRCRSSEPCLRAGCRRDRRFRAFRERYGR